MAILKLTIIRGNDEKGSRLDDISITTGAKRESGKLTHRTAYWEKKVSESAWGEAKMAADISFELSMSSIHFVKKMYAPNEIVADIKVSAVNPNTDIKRKAFINRDDLMAIFANRQVTLQCDGLDVCTDYYVHDIIPRRYKDEMSVTLKIYSPDKLMTLMPYWRNFVGKRLTDQILKTECENFVLPYNEKATVAYNTADMKFLRKDGQEHIFPYLVQYNESFYDFLARTTNRWGEFMFYENGKLNIGYHDVETSADTKDTLTGYALLEWQDLTAKQPQQNNPGTYVGEAPYDNNVLNSTVKKDNYDVVKNTVMNCDDKFWFAKAGQLLTNDKSAMAFAFNTAVDDWVAYGQAKARVDRNNNRINELYFDKASTLGNEHFGDDKYNQFSEIKPIVDAKVYSTVIAGEMKAGKNAIKVEYDTAWPDLHLGDIVVVEGIRYIIVEAEGYQPEEVSTDSEYYHSYVTSELRYRFTAIAEDNKKFYPAVIPAGHVRKCGPQVAVVVDVDDPARTNRVRVKYPWQLTDFIANYDSDKKDDEKLKRYEGITAESLKGYKDLDDASPWLLYANPTGPKGAGIHGRHYLAEKVLVDYADGNVERPYVVGAVSKDIPASLKTGSAVLQAPNYESIRVHEGAGKGASTFMMNLSPGLKLLNGFGAIPAFSKEWKLSELFEGGVEMGDRFGIWGIKCSTDARNISINSPWGDVKLNAFTGITITAPNGDVKIKGKNVTIEAGNNLTLASGSNIKNRFFTLKDGMAGLGVELQKAVAAKLAGMATGFIDISLLRTVIELAFRPIEGALTVKSNRFLKLEAGGGTAAYPNTAYANKKAELAAVKKARKAATNSILWETNFSDDLVRLFGRIRPAANKLEKDFHILHEQARSMKQTFNAAYTRLEEYSDNSQKPCKNYDELKELLWKNEERNTSYTDDQLGMTEHVNTNNPEKMVINNVEYRSTAPNYQVELNDRKQRKNALTQTADALHESIYGMLQLSEMGLSKESIEDVLKDPQGYGFSADVMKKVVASFPKKAISEILVINDDFKKLDTAMPTARRAEMKSLLRRKMAIAVLEGLGFSDQYRKQIDGVVPPKPTTNQQLLDGAVWRKYVQSISMLPKLADNTGTFMSTVTKAVSDTLKKDNLVDALTQNWSWGDAKNGAILFSPAKGTYELGSQIQPRTSLHMSGGLSEEEDPKVRAAVANLRFKLINL